MRIVFIGPPGAGKGTQAVRVAQSLNVPQMSTGEVLREARSQGDKLGIEAGTYLDAGQLVPDETVVQLVADRLSAVDCGAGYLFDGFPRTLNQAEQLDRLLANHGAPLDAAIEFVIPQDELFERLWKRGRSDDKEETIRKRLQSYADLTTPLAAYYGKRNLLGQVDAVGTQDEVFDRLMAALSKLRGTS